MRGKTKTIALIAAFALFIAGSVWLYNSLKANTNALPEVENEQGEVQTGETGEAEKTKAPDFTVYDAEGKAVKRSDMQGTPVVLNFWASWCPPCKSEMPDFDAVYQELGGEVQFMMVDLTDGGRETAETGAAYIKEQGYTFPVFFDTDGEAARAYAVRSIPTTMFIDKDGYIVTGVQGAISEANLRRGIDLIR